MEIIGTIFCGLGLFFIGFRMISRNLRQLTGTRFKKLIQKATGTRLLSALTGFFSGVIFQSASAAVFIASGFHSARLLTLRQSMIIINWANIGTSMLIFIVVLNIKLLIFYFVGLIGMVYFLQLDRTNRSQMMFLFLQGVSMLFLGIFFIKTAAVPLQSLPWFREALQMSSGSVLLLFLAGGLLTVAAQAGSTVTVVALTLSSVGLLNLLQTFIIVLGTGVGSAFNILLFSLKMRGSEKQLCLYQGLFKTSGVITIALLLFLDYRWSPNHQPRLVSMLSANPGKQVAWLFLIMQLLPTFMLTLMRKPVIILLQRISSPTSDEKLSQAEFLSEPALQDPETALYLAWKEQIRLLRILPDYLVRVSPDRDYKKVTDLNVLHDCFEMVDQQITQYLEKLVKNPLAASLQEQIHQTQHFSSVLKDLESNLFEFVTTINTSFETIVNLPFAINLIESLRTILDTAIDCMEDQDPAGMEMLLKLTAEKGDLLQRIRKDYFQKNTSLDLGVQQSLFSLTLQFDRGCWLLRSVTLIRQKALTENQ